MRQILEGGNLEFSFRQNKCEVLISNNVEISGGIGYMNQEKDMS